jgi:hypothetical protein
LFREYLSYAQKEYYLKWWLVYFVLVIWILELFSWERKTCMRGWHTTVFDLAASPIVFAELKHYICFILRIALIWSISKINSPDPKDVSLLETSLQIAFWLMINTYQEHSQNCWDCYRTGAEHSQTLWAPFNDLISSSQILSWFLITTIQDDTTSPLLTIY